MRVSVIIFFINVFCISVVNAQNKNEKIFNVYKAESKVYFDSAARAEHKEFQDWHSQYMLNVTRFETILNKVDSTKNSSDLIKEINKAITKEFKLPESFYKKVKRKLKEKVPG